MRKRLLTGVLVIAMAVFLSACGDTKPEETTETVTTAEAIEETTTEEAEEISAEEAEETTAAAAETTEEAGESSDAETLEFEMPNGKTESWGIYEEVFVPEGMKLTTGDTIDSQNENAVWVSKTDNAMNYLYFVLSTEEQSKKDIAATIEVNGKYNPEEVAIKVGNLVWKGIGYNYLGTDVAQMYAKIGDKVINVRMAGFAYNSDYSAAVLSSIKVKEGGDTDAANEAASKAEATTEAAETTAEAAAEGKNNTAESDPTYGKSNADATGIVTLEVLKDTYAWKNSAGAGITYEDFRDHMGCDGAKWEAVWKDDKHGYMWKTGDGDFLNVSFSVKEDGSEIYSSCTYSDAVRE